VPKFVPQSQRDAVRIRSLTSDKLNSAGVNESADGDTVGRVCLIVDDVTLFSVAATTTGLQLALELAITG
jgi:hypothetical protein